MIIGGIAVSLVGKPRATQDIDGLVLLKGDQQEEFFKKILNSDFLPRLSGAFEFARRRRVLLLEHKESRIKIDISFADLPFQEEALERKTDVSIDDLKIPTPSPEDLVIMKAVAHRPRDIADIEGILPLNPDMDLKRVQYWVREFARVLEMPEIYKDLEKLLKARSKRGRRKRY